MGLDRCIVGPQRLGGGSEFKQGINRNPANNREHVAVLLGIRSRNEPNFCRQSSRTAQGRNENRRRFAIPNAQGNERPGHSDRLNSAFSLVRGAFTNVIPAHQRQRVTINVPGFSQQRPREPRRIHDNVHQLRVIDGTAP